MLDAVEGTNKVASGGIGATLRRVTLHEFAWIWIGTGLLFLVSAIVAPGTVRASAALGTARTDPATVTRIEPSEGRVTVGRTSGSTRRAAAS